MSLEVTKIEVVGKTIKEFDPTHILFEDGCELKFFHNQDCCEYVGVEEVIGAPEDHVGATVISIEEVSENADCNYGIAQWTFYKFKTSAGYLTVRWRGESNGYYSIEVDWHVLGPDGEMLQGARKW